MPHCQLFTSPRILGIKKARLISRAFYLVPKAGLEPARPKSPPPQDGVSTNSTTSAKSLINYLGYRFQRYPLLVHQMQEHQRHLQQVHHQQESLALVAQPLELLNHPSYRLVFLHLQ